MTIQAETTKPRCYHCVDHDERGEWPPSDPNTCPACIAMRKAHRIGTIQTHALSPCEVAYLDAEID